MRPISPPFAVDYAPRMEGLGFDLGGLGDFFGGLLETGLETGVKVGTQYGLQQLLGPTAATPAPSQIQTAVATVAPAGNTTFAQPGFGQTVSTGVWHPLASTPTATTSGVNTTPLLIAGAAVVLAAVLLSR